MDLCNQFNVGSTGTLPQLFLVFSTSNDYNQDIQSDYFLFDWSINTGKLENSSMGRCSLCILLLIVSLVSEHVLHLFIVLNEK